MTEVESGDVNRSEDARGKERDVIGLDITALRLDCLEINNHR